ncbi:MFS general substrate transporter [Tilletiaria anomala UBC 951]|uniref:MFS general substrate transporter n=1 Tax=Tilletiaria anomala (strain ATCC 24038 / CBS 436.72 / UBC 951) TaxID=1037660 RepID=A0A066VEX1_TILAU|nr:MFS general substrate transporter [Tilletiaria anomala UBC 951]KDN40011.1 MFS general substrate transporter [Tilletiaria anomala UBC 951]
MADNVDEELAELPETPLPKLQLFILVLMRITEPIAFTCIFPFINDQCASVLPHVPRAQIGFYSGLIESCFAISQVFVVLLWGRASDYYGRKPILLIGLAGVALSMNAFGLSRTFHGMVLSRCIAGLSNGNIGVLKAILAEITDKTNQTSAFALIPLAYAIGGILGPAIGGTLSDPLGVVNSDSTLPKNDRRFLARYPFFLPCVVASMFNIFAILLGACFLPETLPRHERKVRRQQQTSASQDGSAIEAGDSLEAAALAEVSERRAAPLLTLITKQVFSVISSQMLLNLLNVSYAALLPLFCYTHVTDGGIGFKRTDIGSIMGANGVLSIFMQLLLLPWLMKRVGGPLHLFRIVVPFFALVFLCFPFAQQQAAWGFTPGVWAALGLMVVLKTVANTSLVCVTLLVNNNAPSRAALGTVNGLSSMCGSAARAMGPASATSLFAYSAAHGLRWLVWIAGSTLALTAWALTFRIRPAAPAL